MTQSRNSEKKQIIGIIPARYASTRFPAKMMAPISGKTLIQRTYENALRCSLFDTLLIATDDTRIFQHVRDFGADVVMTSTECPTGTDRLVEVLKRDERYDSASIVVNIQGDVPCLEPSVIYSIVAALQNDPEAVMSTAITKFHSMEEALLPSNVKCVIDKNHNALYFSRTLIPAPRKGMPETSYYHHIGIYAYRRDFLLRYTELPQTPLQLAEDLEQLKVLEHGFRIKTAIVDSVSFGVDIPEDIQKVEQWLCKQNTSSSPVVSARHLAKD